VLHIALASTEAQGDTMKIDGSARRVTADVRECHNPDCLRQFAPADGLSPELHYSAACAARCLADRILRVSGIEQLTTNDEERGR
jgi:hypothetical protein